ncbi:hypothetical protein L1987_33385 [Smallanthus sonchifolius]|uniref:Uncharacterized protein n=1 Tax=Smallanthus sonchifolius TaxID=185202 RepID=A0ACB9HSA5_9ASTR|nr:hypothetical protein L1987_33385 [Smallanthus sonchifolius]
MEMDGFEPNDVTVISVLRACAETGALSVGMKLSEFVNVKGIKLKKNLVTAFIDILFGKGMRKTGHLDSVENQQKQSEDMDFMDIDQIEEVPDTPERFITSCNNDGNNTGSHGNGSSSCRVIDRDCFNQKLRNEPWEKGKSVSFHGNRRLFVRPDCCSDSPGTNLGNSTSSKNVVPTVENPHHDKGKTLCNSSGFVDLTERNRHDRVFGLNNAIKLGPRSDFRKGVVFGGQHKAENSSSSLASTPPRVHRHKRLVRNGCISPLNIAKTKQVEEKHDISRVTNTASDGPSSKVDIKDIISEAKDSHRFKGKGVSHHPSVLENPDARNTHLSQRRSVIFKEASDASKESEGWITTHSTIRKVDPTSVNGDQHIPRGKSASSSVNDQSKNGKVHANHRNGSTSSSFYTRFENLERAQFTKRQREGVGSSNRRECDVAYVNNADMASSSVNVGSSSTSRSTRNNNRRGAGSSDQADLIDELSHEGGNHGSSSNEDATVRALQLEADERLARELQEQLYTEELSTGFGIDELDSHHALAMAMQQEHGLRARGRPASHSRSNASRSVSSNRAQAPASTRLARLRGRFPGRPRTISSTRSSIFPPNMDVDMRMQILEALEAFNDMELPNSLLQVGREFNESDYEMLLALDDNNHQHGGATYAQINNLPQSTVQAENLQECAICLEAPSVGETIRHLPCLHKFHKDCIDEWLRRKTSCPVCKSSVT